MRLLFGNSLWQLVVMSDAMSKLVIFVLFGMSILCWTVFFYKFVLIRLKKRQLFDGVRAIRSVRSLQELLNLSSAFVTTMPGYFLSRNLSFLKSILQKRSDENQMLSAQEWQDVIDSSDETFEDIMHNENQYMPILYASAGVSTLMGLFGTVWGLVHSFVRISEKQSADITTVAPGIAEALMTTLAGLMVAIPAFLMFHYLENEIKKIEFNLGKFVDRYNNVLKKIFMAKESSHDADITAPGTDKQEPVELGN